MLPNMSKSNSRYIINYNEKWLIIKYFIYINYDVNIRVIGKIDFKLPLF